ncbi:putative DNA-binding domain-containing protein [Alteromonas sp. KUL49]|uniref:HvfC family RiPP maturation protein n=1 Tax=Alteromonas sp. KUL49 TaxID=2480798 RepID=UPI00102EE447|nr:putative DNA-binding domain-containing protein [Alteromonas sp. KUL49]TAP34144.1 DUF2063 domain-containing protein [Alteromonas sp. KUL49]GEA13631.1 DUF2063 domain-containing protein [Alteromonas sp. KUL49]
MIDNHIELQEAFARDIRDPSSAEYQNEDIQRRMAIYQSLFFNNIESFLASAFPIAKKLLPEKQWTQLARDFFIHHSCKSPYFADISKAFVEYLSASPKIVELLPEFFSELVHYEWLELDISIRKGKAVNEGSEGTLVFSPLASLVSYAYPVHMIGEEFQPTEPSAQRHFYVVYRNSSHEVNFVTVTPISAIMLDTIEQCDEGITAEALVEALTEKLPQVSRDAIAKGVENTISTMLESEILIKSE